MRLKQRLLRVLVRFYRTPAGTVVHNWLLRRSIRRLEAEHQRNVRNIFCLRLQVAATADQLQAKYDAGRLRPEVIAKLRERGLLVGDKFTLPPVCDPE